MVDIQEQSQYGELQRLDLVVDYKDNELPFNDSVFSSIEPIV